MLGCNSQWFYSYIHSLSMHQLLNGQPAELPTILDNLLTGIANITSTLIRVEPQNSRQRLCQHWKRPNCIYWHQFMCIHISHKAVKSMAKLIDQLCGELWLAVCLLCHLKTTEHSWTSDKPQRQASAKYRLGKFHDQHQYLREFLVNLYSYCLMVKSVPCCWKVCLAVVSV